MMCCVLFDALQQTVGLPLVSLGFQHNLGQRRRVRQVCFPNSAAFGLLWGSRVVAGVDHPRRNKTTV